MNKATKQIINRSFILLIILLISIFISNSIFPKNSVTNNSQSASLITAVNNNNSSSINFVLNYTLANEESNNSPINSDNFASTNRPLRNWKILDPTTNTFSIAMEDLTNYFPFYYKNITSKLPLGSLTQLLTAIVAEEKIGLNKKIPATIFNQNEVWLSSDLIKLLIMTFNGDVANALANYYNYNNFITELNNKAIDIGMQQTHLVDASGLSSQNISTVGDIVKLIRYIILNHPELLNWSLIPSTILQPINGSHSYNITNSNVFINSKNFIGGQIGTTNSNLNNFAGVININGHKIIFVLLGDNDIVTTVNNLSTWVAKAYLW
ncbi:MAG: hypothetical protein ACP5IC_00145 [Minisyncoccia bacterium]